MRTLIIAAIGALAFMGCGSSKKDEYPAGQASAQGKSSGGETGMQSGMAAVCPMEIEGTTVQAEVVDGGASLVFVTTGDVDALRQRVRNLAAMQETSTMGRPGMGAAEPMQPGMPGEPSVGAKAAEPGMTPRGGGPMPETQGGSASAGMGEASMMPEVDTRVEDIEDGARLVILAAHPIDLDAVRAHVEKQAMSMSAGQCPTIEPATEQPTG